MLLLLNLSSSLLKESEVLMLMNQNGMMNFLLWKRKKVILLFIGLQRLKNRLYEKSTDSYLKGLSGQDVGAWVFNMMVNQFSSSKPLYIIHLYKYHHSLEYLAFGAYLQFLCIKKEQMFLI